MNFRSARDNIAYFDNAASTPCDQRVVEAMMPYWVTGFGNPSSNHIFGQLAYQMIEKCRHTIIANLGGAGRLVFTSGSTEGNNIAVYSILRYVRERLNRDKIFCLSTEHKSIINSVIYFSNLLDVQVEWIPVMGNGLINWDWLGENMNDEVGAVIAQLANSETGVIQDLESVATLCHHFGAKCFADITQAIGKLNINLDVLGVDFATFAAHKFYGPKGVGALYIAPEMSVSPLLFGGGQEKGIRSGTENVPGIIGMTKALTVASDEFQMATSHVKGIRDSVWGYLSELDNVRWNGGGAPILPSHLNVTVHQVNAQDLMLRTRTVAFSAGSACNATTNSPSPVLLAMGMVPSEAEQTIRLSFGKFNTSSEAQKACAILCNNIKSIRRDQKD